MIRGISACKPLAMAYGRSGRVPKKSYKRSKIKLSNARFLKPGLLPGTSCPHTYQNAIIELVKDDAAPYFTFAFEYSDEVDTEHDNVRAKKLTIKYPALEKHSDPRDPKSLSGATSSVVADQMEPGV